MNKQLQTQPVIIDQRYLLTNIQYASKSSIIYNAVDLKEEYEGIVMQIILTSEMVLLKLASKLIDTYVLPQIYCRGIVRVSEHNYTYFIQKKGGPSLKMCFQFMQQQFSYRTIALIALKLKQLSHLQTLHYRNIIHRNLRLSTILTSKNSELYLTNFEHSTKFTIRNGKVIGPQLNNHQFNIYRFSSIGSHLQQTPFPKDDLESLVYIVIHLVTGGEVFKSKSKLCTYDEKIRYYFEIKNKLVVEKVLKSHPENFSQFYHMVNQLNPSEMPNYDQLQQPFLKLLGKDLINFQFDWIKILNQKKDQKTFFTYVVRQQPQSAKDFDDNLRSIYSDTDSQKSAPPSQCSNKIKLKLVKNKHSKFCNQKQDDYDTEMLPPILEKNESDQTTMNKLSCRLSGKLQKESSSGNVSSHGDEETHISTPPHLSKHLQKQSI